MRKPKEPVGKKDQILTIQRAVETRDTDGSVLKEWVEFRQVWGAVTPLTARESYIGQGVNAQVEYSIPIRPYIEGVGPHMRVVAGTRTFEITGVEGDGRNGELELLCTERV
jgi:SPP1 family predicted phage head-tail adaptor